MSQSKEGPGGTPTVVGEQLFVIGMGGRVACLNTQDGEIVWQRSLTEDFGGTIPPWSYRESPLLDGDKLICTPGSSEALIVALNKVNGETIWKSQMPGASNESSEERSSAVPNQRSQERDRPARTEMANRSTGNSSAPQISGTEDSALFLSEHWGMTAFAHKVPWVSTVQRRYSKTGSCLQPQLRELAAAR